NIKERSLIAIDTDTQAFYDMMDAARLPKKTDEDKKIRSNAIQEATKKAILVPLETLEIALEAAKLATKVAKIGNTNALSDAGVAAITANAAAKSAYLNVTINMGSIEDEKFKFDILTKSEEVLKKTNNLALQVEKEIKSNI
ncbi:MAG: cyclodeaminase/cyclohydrolase family protein, partial [Candidatus Tenebribacter mawsonii]|nr:cyclodeaminase/cyclohydrolase family protein [Candidatus Tenebribacter mawsonii]